MKTIFKFASTIIAAAVLCSCGISSDIPEQDLPPEETITTEKPVSYGSMLSCDHYYPKDFDVYTSFAETYETKGEIICGTVPHHLTAGRMTASFMQTAAGSRKQTDAIIILGTMHDFRGDEFVTTDLDWNSPFGRVSNHNDITDKLASSVGAVCDNDLMEYDHAVSSVIPFAGYYFPDVPVSCLLVSNRANKDTPEKLCGILAEISRDYNCLFVFSIDFSHYLSPDMTEIYDAQTLEAVTEKDLETISEMTDKNVDSAHLLGTFLRLSDALDAQTRMHDHSTTPEITDIPYSRTNYFEGITSYYVFASEK